MCYEVKEGTKGVPTILDKTWWCQWLLQQVHQAIPRHKWNWSCNCVSVGICTQIWNYDWRLENCIIKLFGKLWKTSEGYNVIDRRNKRDGTRVDQPLPTSIQNPYLATYIKMRRKHNHRDARLILTILCCYNWDRKGCTQPISWTRTCWKTIVAGIPRKRISRKCSASDQFHMFLESTWMWCECDCSSGGCIREWKHARGMWSHETKVSRLALRQHKKNNISGPLWRTWCEGPGLFPKSKWGYSKSGKRQGRPVTGWNHNGENELWRAERCRKVKQKLEQSRRVENCKTKVP